MPATQQPEPVVYQPMSLPPRRRLDVKAPLSWLREGGNYLARHRGVSIAYGGVFALIGMLITWLGVNQPQFVLTFWSGFLLVGPILATGTYRIAQLADRGETVRLSTCWHILRRRLGSVALFSLLLAVVMIAWIRFSTLAAALYIGNIAGSSGFIAALATPEGAGFLLILFGVGAVFAVIMFALTAWSLPLVMDGRAEFGVAVVTSVRAVIEQPAPMLVWGGLVAGLTLVGMLTFFAAFAVIFPWLGYATWAAYKDLFGRD